MAHNNSDLQSFLLVPTRTILMLLWDPLEHLHLLYNGVFYFRYNNLIGPAAALIFSEVFYLFLRISCKLLYLFCFAFEDWVEPEVVLLFHFLPISGVKSEQKQQQLLTHIIKFWLFIFQCSSVFKRFNGIKQ